MPAYLLGAGGKTSDETGVIGSGPAAAAFNCCWTRGLSLGDEMCDRFSLVVDGVIGGAGVDDEVFVDADNGGGFGLEDFFAASSDASLPADVFSMHRRLLIQPQI